MARTPKIDQKLVAKARAVASETQDIHLFKAAQSILLPADMNTTLEQTASLLGVSRMTAYRLQRQFRSLQKEPHVKPPRKRWGGRRRSLLSLAEEKEFLAPWVKQAKEAGMIVVSPLRAALAEKVGKPISGTVVYRLLSRHGWRKIAPDTKHPKNNPRIMKDWKKNFRHKWTPC